MVTVPSHLGPVPDVAGHVGGREHARDRAADAARSPGDHRYLAGEVVEFREGRHTVIVACVLRFENAVFTVCKSRFRNETKMLSLSVNDTFGPHDRQVSGTETQLRQHGIGMLAEGGDRVAGADRCGDRLLDGYDGDALEGMHGVSFAVTTTSFGYKYPRRPDPETSARAMTSR